MIGWIILAIYLLGWAVAAHFIAIKVYEDLTQWRTDTENRYLAGIAGILVGFMWPVWLTIIGGAHLLTKGFTTR